MLAKDGVLARVIRIEGRLAHVGAPGDLVDRGGLVPALAHEGDRGLGDAALDVGLLALPEPEHGQGWREQARGSGGARHGANGAAKGADGLSVELDTTPRSCAAQNILFAIRVL